MNRQLSLKKVIFNDLVSFLCFLFPIIFCGMITFFSLKDGSFSAATWLLILAGAILFAGIIGLTWRINQMTNIINDGVEVQGVINNVFFFRDRGTIQYIFTYQDEKLYGNNKVMETKMTKQYKVGQQVVILVDRNNPKRSLIRDLFVKAAH